jgi:hypothetical protein
MFLPWYKILPQFRIGWEVKELTSNLQHAKYFIHLLPSLLGVHLTKICLLQGVNFIFQLLQYQEMLTKDFGCGLERRYDNLLPSYTFLDFGVFLNYAIVKILHRLCCVVVFLHVIYETVKVIFWQTQAEVGFLVFLAYLFLNCFDLISGATNHELRSLGAESSFGLSGWLEEGLSEDVGVLTILYQCKELLLIVDENTLSWGFMDIYGWFWFVIPIRVVALISSWFSRQFSLWL